ncbi:MAG: hypothetical protein WKH64_18325, partial [Chloroflexia bacterium]
HMSLAAGLAGAVANETDEEGEEPERYRTREDAGWWLYCNDRLLLRADTSRITGWGAAVANYHPQYRQFRGYVFLEGEARFMPWNTTKTSVDEDSELFRQVQTQMFEALEQAVPVINRLKTERQQLPEEDRRASRHCSPLSRRPCPSSAQRDLHPAPSPRADVPART